MEYPVVKTGAGGWPYITYVNDNVSLGGGSVFDHNTALDSAISASRSQAAQAVNSSRSGVQAILDARPDIDKAVNAMRRNARGIEAQADTLRGYGDSMWESGTKVTEQALATLGTGLGFINMDASASPLVAEAMRLYGEFDPDQYVASAAQDVQSQGDNARAQGVRNLSRMGVNPTSGAALALNRLYDRSLAVARAAAMTRARQQGLKDQASAFQSLVANNANTFLQTGGELAKIGQSGQAAAVDAQKGAGALLGAAAGVYGDAGKLGLSYAGSLAGAYNSLAGVQLNQAKNTNDTEAVRVSAINGHGATGGGSVITGRHIGVGGELLATGNPKVDAQLQMARDAVPTTYEKNLGLA